jgi:ribosomal protein L12E/L44/L45/RPP1/RPP2
MRVEDVPEPELADLVEDLSDLRHDLGKYVTFGVRFLGPGPSVDDLRAALEGDLLRTARRGEVTETAWQVWDRLRPAGLDADPDVQRIDAGVAALQGVDLSGGEDQLTAAAEQARAVAEATRSLHRRAARRLH